ncbi:MAG: hypothetical protein II621_07455 [Clostridia bacterium]|nr:hypothetical protein [Clostridia bacterium]
MKRLVDFIGAFLTAVVLCAIPARADVIGGPVIAVGLLGIVLLFAVAAAAASILIRAVGRLRAKRKEDETKEDR